MTRMKSLFAFFFGTVKGRIVSFALLVGALATLPLLESFGLPAIVAFILLVLFLGGMLVASIASQGMNLAGVDVDGAEIAERLTIDASGQEILRRWIVRSRWHRYVGGLAGFLFAAGLGSHYLVCSLGGLMIGSVVGLTARLGRVVKGERSADLTPRSMKTYVAMGQQYVLYALAAVASALLLLAVGLRDIQNTPALSAIWLWPLSVVAVVLGVLVVQRRVVVRPRPAMADRLRSSDDLLRYLTNTRSLADPALALGFVLLGEAIGAWGGPESFAELGEGIGHLVGIGFWWQNRRLGLDQIRDVKPVGVAPKQIASA